HVDLVQQVRVLGEALVVVAERGGESVELLPERHRHGVLQLRAADLEDVVELTALARNAWRSSSSSSSRVSRSRLRPILIAVGYTSFVDCERLVSSMGDRNA